MDSFYNGCRKLSDSHHFFVQLHSLSFKQETKGMNLELRKIKSSTAHQFIYSKETITNH